MIAPWDGDRINLKIATWNLARVLPKQAARTAKIVGWLDRVDADVWVLTENTADQLARTSRRRHSLLVTRRSRAADVRLRPGDGQPRRPLSSGWKSVRLAGREESGRPASTSSAGH
jgi:hypothetical protein